MTEWNRLTLEKADRERLQSQLDRALALVAAQRDEIAHLNDELNACQSELYDLRQEQQ